MAAPGVTEVQGHLYKAGQVKLDTDGNGVLIFEPYNAHQRWEVSSVVVSTNQDSTAVVVPVATVALNAVALETMNPGDSRGASWSGNQDSFDGTIHVSPCDWLSVLFSAPPGQGQSVPADDVLDEGGGPVLDEGGGNVTDEGTPSVLSGVIATASLTGAFYTRRR